jgi:hypothetical protein
VSGDQVAGELAKQLERLRHRIDNVTATVLDKELWARLSPIREHLSITAAMLADPTRDTLPQVVDRLRIAETQLAAVLELGH